MSGLVCNYCSCPRRVDPGCPAQNVACAMGCPSASPTPATSGGSEPSVSEWINRMLPNCPANAAYAQWAIENDILRPVSKTDPCPTGYSYVDSYDNHMLCKTTTRSEIPPEPIFSNLIACRPASSPSPSPVQDPVCNYCACPPRVDVGCPPQRAACDIACPDQSKGLPGWAIALIVILLVLLLGGIGFMMTRRKPTLNTPLSQKPL
jgi:hypothetical protein